MNTQARIEPRVYGFIDLLKELNDKTTLHELDEALDQLIKLVRARGAKGTLTYQLTIDPIWLDEGVEVRFAFDDKITVKPPEKKRSREFLFAGHGPLLYASNPWNPDPDEAEIVEADVVEEEPFDMFTTPPELEAAPDQEGILS